MNTINESFNDAWEALAKLHTTGFLPNGESFDIGEYPSQRITKANWKEYLGNLIDVIVIGKRNKYLHIHVDGKGHASYFFVPEDIASGKIKLPWMEKGSEEHVS